MNRMTLKKLVIESYHQGELDVENVNRIATVLTKKELKLYIRALKNWEKQNTVAVDVPNDDATLMNEMRNLFPDKKIVIDVDPSLLLGMRIKHQDDIYEMSLKNSLHKITEHIEENYD